MSRILKRPMFKKGGLSEETGIMSGLDRKGYAQGSYAPRVNYATGFPGVLTGFETPYGKTGSQIASEAAKKVTALDRLKKLKNLKNFNFNKIPTDTQIGKTLMKYGKKIGKLKLPGLAYRNPLSIGLPAALGIKASLIAPTEADKEYGVKDWEKVIASSLPGGDQNIPLMLRKALGVEKKVEEEPEEEVDSLDKDGGEKELKGDMESDLMRAYKEYAPIFEKELGVSSDDTKKQLYMQLAKFGAGLAAQPGGDLVGAIGRAAEKPLEGAGETVKDVSTAKRQAKLLALQTALEEGKAGPIGKAINDIAKAYKVSKEEAATIYERWQTNNNTANAAITKRYAIQAETLGLKMNSQERYINESRDLALDHPKLVGRFNEILPENWEDSENIGGYFVTEQGQFVRVVEQDGEVVRIAMDEPGFEDKPKAKK